MNSLLKQGSLYVNTLLFILVAVVEIIRLMQLMGRIKNKMMLEGCSSL